jgi:hypothetical protein
MYPIKDVANPCLGKTSRTASTGRLSAFYSVFTFIFFCFMLGCRSLSLPLISCDLDIERTLRQLRSVRNSNLLKEHPTKTMGDNNPMALRDHNLPTTYTSPICLSCQMLRQLTMRLSLALYRVYHLF